MLRLLLVFALLGLARTSQATGQTTAPNGLYYVTVGAGPRTIVVLHGGPGYHHNYLRPEWDRLTGLGRVLYYDQRGCGLSIKTGPFGWRQHVADLDYLLTLTTPNRPVVLAGSSWGAWLALLYAYSHPSRVEKLVLSGLPAWPDTAWGKRYRRLPDSTLALLDSLVYGQRASLRFQDSAEVVASTPLDVLPEQLLPRLGSHCLDVATGAFASLLAAPPLDSLRTLTMPVLLLEGTGYNRQGSGVYATSRVLPQATVAVVPQGRHDPWFNQPDVTFPIIENFLQSETSSTH